MDDLLKYGLRSIVGAKTALGPSKSGKGLHRDNSTVLTMLNSLFVSRSTVAMYIPT